MSTVEEHYEDLLAEIYTWMGGGLPKKVEEHRHFFQLVGLTPQGCGNALDLGCGSGFQTHALASLGYHVLGVDTNERLLGELQAFGNAERIQVVKGDMRDPSVYEPVGPFEVAVCMGDTLIHLQSFEEVASCMAALRRCIEPGGRLIVSFRDLTLDRKGLDRAIPVRLEEDRLMVAFLEYEPEHLVIHDVVIDRGGGTWKMRQSAYKKLRLAPVRFAELLTDLGFKNVLQNTDSGSSTTIAEV